MKYVYALSALLVALLVWFLRPSWDTLPRRPRFMYTYPETGRTPRGLEGWMKNG